MKVYRKKHLICYSGGHTSALVAIEVSRKYGTKDLVLINHDINSNVEHEDIKRFKKQVAEYIGVPITYVNMPDFDFKDQFDVVIEAKAFKVGNGTALCSNRLKTKPFENYLLEKFPHRNCICYYGFLPEEQSRIQRRASFLGLAGYKTDFPLALWKNRTIYSTKEIGITPPLTYQVFKHGNCVGCLKAGKQHWYCVYCLRPDIWEKAKYAEDQIGYSIIKGIYLDELEEEFEEMKQAGIRPTEHIPFQTFWAEVRKVLSGSKSVFEMVEPDLPCECI